MAEISDVVIEDVTRKMGKIASAMQERPEGELSTDLKVLVEQARQAAAMREFLAAQLADYEKWLAILEGYVLRYRDREEDKMAEVTASVAPELIARSFAAHERKADVDVRTIDSRIERRNLDEMLRFAEASRSSLRAIYQAWRDREFAIDRLVRLTSLRHQIGEL